MKRRVKLEEFRYAGRTEDGEFAVVTISGRVGDEDLDHCVRPCPSCPWRKDSPIGAFPAEAYRHSASTAYDMSTNTFSCHVAGKEAPKTCAGFLMRGADHNLAIRLAAIRGRYDLDAVSDGGHELYRDYREMAEANGVPADDPRLRPCRGWDR